MKIDADPRSPHYWQRHFKSPSVKLDGVEMAEVLEADSEAGTVTCVSMDSGGRPRYAGGEFIKVISHGKVEISEAA